MRRPVSVKAFLSSFLFFFIPRVFHRKLHARIVWQRRHVKIDLIKCIGKESNSLETVDEGLEHSEKNVYTVYDDPRRSEWIVKIQPALKKPKLEVVIEACGKRLCRREIIELRAGRKKPHRRTQQLLESILKQLGFL